MGELVSLTSKPCVVLYIQAGGFGQESIGNPPRLATSQARRPRPAPGTSSEGRASTPDRAGTSTRTKPSPMKKPGKRGVRTEDGDEDDAPRRNARKQAGVDGARPRTRSGNASDAVLPPPAPHAPRRPH